MLAPQAESQLKLLMADVEVHENHLLPGLTGGFRTVQTWK